VPYAQGTVNLLPGSAPATSAISEGSRYFRFGSLDLSSGAKIPAAICLPA
jgi:hypothetical protein